MQNLSGGHFEVDDIKLFLRATINKRGVRINEYFPDIKQCLKAPLQIKRSIG